MINPILSSVRESVLTLEPTYTASCHFVPYTIGLLFKLLIPVHRVTIRLKHNNAQHLHLRERILQVTFFSCRRDLVCPLFSFS